MREGKADPFPPLIELHRMCSTRAPGLDWRVSRLAAILEDFPEVNWRMVTGRALDYIREREGVKDGPRTLRTFMEREQRELASARKNPRADKPDLWTRCVRCGQDFNISAEVRRSHLLGLRDQVSTCQRCFEEERNASQDQDTSSSSAEGRSGRPGGRRDPADPA